LNKSGLCRRVEGALPKQTKRSVCRRDGVGVVRSVFGRGIGRRGDREGRNRPELVCTWMAKEDFVGGAKDGEEVLGVGDR